LQLKVDTTKIFLIDLFKNASTEVAAALPQDLVVASFLPFFLLGHILLAPTTRR